MLLSNGKDRDLEQVAKLGRGNSSFSGLAMDRDLVEVVEVPGGWSVVGITEPHTMARKDDAMHLADRICYWRHRHTGAPTGVSLQLQCGDVVLAAQYG